MIHFAQAQYLFLIFLIPVFFVIQAVLLRLRKRKIRKFGDEKLVEQLMPSYSKSKVWVRLTLFSIGFFFFAIGLSRPQIGARLKEQEIKGAEIIIAMDVSNSMLAEDYSPNRLDRAKLAVSRLVDKLRDDRIGLVIFAGTSFVQLPVTTDYVSAKMFLNTIDTGSIPIQGTAMGDAITTCIRSFSQQSDKSRAIILITDGENHEDDPVAAAKQAAEMGIKVFTIGVGSPEGKPIPMNGELLKDKDGEIVVSRLDEEVLKEVAQAGNGAYVRAGNSEFGLNPIIEDLKKLEDEKYNSIVFEEFDEQFMYFLAIALFFFVLEMLVGDRRSKRHLFQR
jgi:Ca-activated chloride channel family protein